MRAYVLIMKSFLVRNGAKLRFSLSKSKHKNDSRLVGHVTLLYCREEELATNSSKETVLSDATTANHTHATDKP